MQEEYLLAISFPPPTLPRTVKGVPTWVNLLSSRSNTGKGSSAPVFILHCMDNSVGSLATLLVRVTNFF